MRLCNKNNSSVISGGNSDPLNVKSNHLKYCNTYNYNYKFYKRTDVNPPYFIKCYAILESLQNFEYLLWIDNDVFFINQSWNIEEIFLAYKEDIIVTQGRAKKSGTTLFNNGIIFIRNTQISKWLFRTMLDTNYQTVAKNYQKDWGPIDSFDQSRMIYLTQAWCPNNLKILPYPGFNAHEESFKNQDFVKKTNPPLLHVTGKNKLDKLERFKRNTGINVP